MPVQSMCRLCRGLRLIVNSTISIDLDRYTHILGTSISASICHCLSIYLSTYLPIYLSIYLLSIYYLSTYLYIHLPSLSTMPDAIPYHITSTDFLLISKLI